MNEEKITFKGTPVTSVYSGDNFRVYGVEVTRKEREEHGLILDERYHTLTICGDLPDLTLHTEYIITAIPKESKRGISYNVYKIHKEKPTNQRQAKNFLTEILTDREAGILLSAYPNIIDMVMKNEYVDLSKTTGIKDKKFSKIKQKIIEEIYLMDLIDEYKDYNLSLSMLRKLYDKYTSVDRIKEKMNQDPYKCLCAISGIGFKIADKNILKIHKELRTSFVRMKSCIFYLLNENEANGNTWIDYDELKKQCELLVNESMDYFEENVKNDTRIYYHKNKIANKKTYEAELYISNTIKSLIKKPYTYYIDYENYKYMGENCLTNTQANVLKQICENNICLLAGFGGSGKTFSTQAVINMLDDNNKSYMLLAPTGRASKVMASYTSKNASTIHRGLKYNPKLGWIYNENNKLDVDFVIIDETSMVDVFLMQHLFEAIDIKRTKLLFVFDPEQIPSVSCGKIAYDMIESGLIPTTILTQIFRFGEGGLYNISTKIRNGEVFINSNFRGIKNYGQKKDYSIISVNQDKCLEYLKQIYLKLIKDGENINDILITGALNKGDYGCYKINEVIQELINPSEEGKDEIVLNKRIFRVNDRVMQVKNNYEAVNSNYDEDEIFNGDIGTITEITRKEIFVEYDDKAIIYEKSELDQLELAYAVNIYKLQGSQCKNIIIVTPISHKYFLNKNLLYTGITRARQRVYHICTPDVINSALKKSANFNRNTFLKELLIN